MAAFLVSMEWYANPNSDKSFLADFLIISDSTMTSAGAGEPLSGGFQEQLTMIPDPAPEPRAAIWLVMALFAILDCLCRPGSRLSSIKISS